MPHSWNEFLKTRVIILVDAEKAFKMFQYFFMIKTPNKLEIEENLLSIIKVTYEKPIGNITLNGETLNAFPLGSARKGYPYSPLLLNVLLEISGNNKRHLNWEGRSKIISITNCMMLYVHL